MTSWGRDVIIDVTPYGRDVIINMTSYGRDVMWSRDKNPFSPPVSSNNLVSDLLAVRCTYRRLVMCVCVVWCWPLSPAASHYNSPWRHHGVTSSCRSHSIIMTSSTGFFTIVTKTIMVGFCTIMSSSWLGLSSLWRHHGEEFSPLWRHRAGEVTLLWRHRGGKVKHYDVMVVVYHCDVITVEINDVGTIVRHDGLQSFGKFDWISRSQITPSRNHIGHVTLGWWHQSWRQNRAGRLSTNSDVIIWAWPNASVWMMIVIVLLCFQIKMDEIIVH